MSLSKAAELCLKQHAFDLYHLNLLKRGTSVIIKLIDCIVLRASTRQLSSQFQSSLKHWQIVHSIFGSAYYNMAYQTLRAVVFGTGHVITNNFDVGLRPNNE